MGLPALEPLTRRLIDIPGTTGEEDAIAREVGGVLSDLGFEVSYQEVAPGRPNLLARRPGRPLGVLFNTHLDTVPPYFPSSVEGGIVRGRGACDTRGCIAAMLHAGERLLAGGVEDFSYLLVVGEEVDHIGAIRARELGLDPLACIVGEPTECVLASGQKGILKLRIVCEGKAGHSAYPKVGRSAIHDLLPRLRRVLQYPWPEDPVLGETTVNVGEIAGGVAANVFAPEASATVMLRLAMPRDEAEAQALELLGAADPTVQCSILSGNDPVALETAPGFETAPVAFNTDVAYLGFERNLLYGPGSILVAHGKDEHVRVEDLEQAAAGYERLVRHLLG